MKLESYLSAVTAPKANADSTIQGDGYRITMLTDELIRVEKGQHFTDEATQTVWFRNFGKPAFKLIEEDNVLYIETKKVKFWFNKRTKKVFAVTFLKDSRTVKCSNKNNLKGTCRTLDITFGRIPLKNGIMSKDGVSILDDSKSLLLIDGVVEPRKHAIKDLYIFAYSNNYRQCLFDFFQLTGRVPLIPRYALGNWWSRYRAYTQQEYISLMERFKLEGIPISVATIDMDWHWVDVDKKFGYKERGRLTQGAGWTGYSWNTELFPNYKQLLNYLHQEGYCVTLNIHPADGVRWFEDQYKEMAKRLGVDYRSQKTIEFDMTNLEFIDAYFKLLHNPYEEDGVDFWWIDWQQGKKTKMKGLDPLWMLNHYHFLDISKSDKRPLILSRYSGVGSHRYPLGFSGDTLTYWSSLKFQPYFTATASNIGYTWWSHDIGGHMFGIKDDELYLRWIQFGVFSPINRLHSTSHDLQGKEPWNFSDIIYRYTKEFLALRHRLIPYIYTMNYRTHKYGIALCEPMYYLHSDDEHSYKYNNQYYFGSELIVAPVVTKRNKRISASKTRVWLPKGRWTDIFTGHIYAGGKAIDMHRGLESIPVLAKEGAIIPLSNNKKNDWHNPKEMEVLIYRGNNTFTLYEDDGESNQYSSGSYANTKFEIKEDKQSIEFIIRKPSGEMTVLPNKRKLLLSFKDIIAGDVSVYKGQEVVKTFKKNDASGIQVGVITTGEEWRIKIRNYTVKKNTNYREHAMLLMSKYQAGNISKMLMYRKFKDIYDKDEYIYQVKRLSFRYRTLRAALLEVLQD